VSLFRKSTFESIFPDPLYLVSCVAYLGNIMRLMTSRYADCAAALFPHFFRSMIMAQRRVAALRASRLKGAPLTQPAATAALMNFLLPIRFMEPPRAEQHGNSSNPAEMPHNRASVAEFLFARMAVQTGVGKASLELPAVGGNELPVAVRTTVSRQSLSKVMCEVRMYSAAMTHLSFPGTFLVVTTISGAPPAFRMRGYTRLETKQPRNTATPAAILPYRSSHPT